MFCDKYPYPWFPLNGHEAHEGDEESLPQKSLKFSSFLHALHGAIKVTGMPGHDHSYHQPKG